MIFMEIDTTTTLTTYGPSKRKRSSIECIDVDDACFITHRLNSVAGDWKSVTKWVIESTLKG